MRAARIKKDPSERMEMRKSKIPACEWRWTQASQSCEGHVPRVLNTPQFPTPAAPFKTQRPCHVQCPDRYTSLLRCVWGDCCGRWRWGRFSFHPHTTPHPTPPRAAPLNRRRTGAKKGGRPCGRRCSSLRPPHASSRLGWWRRPTSFPRGRNQRGCPRGT